jgi:hypothetical protein
MNIRSTKTTLTSVWLLVMVAVGLAVGVSSLRAGLILAAVAVLPPLVLAFWWGDPEQTLSESIREGRAK